jgi:hypothetical protein
MSGPEPSGSLLRRADLVELATIEHTPFATVYLPLPEDYVEGMSKAMELGQARAVATERLVAEGLSERDAVGIGERIELGYRRATAVREPQAAGLALFLWPEGERALCLPRPPETSVYVADTPALREAVRQLDAVDPLPEPGEAGPAAHLVSGLDRIIEAGWQRRLRRLWTRGGARVSGRLVAGSARITAVGDRDGCVLEALTALALRCGARAHVVDDLPLQTSATAELQSEGNGT